MIRGLQGGQTMSYSTELSWLINFTSTKVTHWMEYVFGGYNASQYDINTGWKIAWLNEPFVLLRNNDIISNFTQQRKKQYECPCCNILLLGIFLINTAG